MGPLLVGSDRLSERWGIGRVTVEAAAASRVDHRNGRKVGSFVSHTRNVAAIAVVSRFVVIADWWFTATDLPPRYWRYLSIWTALGVPALLLFLAIFWLMVARPPVIWLFG